MSREINGLRISEVPGDCAARISARLVTDFDPGIESTPRMGLGDKGAGQIFIDTKFTQLGITLLSCAGATPQLDQLMNF